MESLTCHKPLPPEMWSSILEWLLKEECIGDLRNCQRVSKEWNGLCATLLQDVLPMCPSLHSDTASTRCTGVLQAKGMWTYFTNAESMDHFIHQRELGNPIALRNNGIFLNPSSIVEHPEMLRRLPTFVSRFSDEVQHCGYHFDKDVPDSFLYFPYVYSFKNLCTLSIYAHRWEHWNGDELETCLNTLEQALECTPPPKSLETVKIYGSQGCHVLNRIVFPKYQSQIKSIRCFERVAFALFQHKVRQIFSENTPNLEYIQVSEAHMVLLDHIAHSNWNLKQLSLSFPSYQQNHDDFISYLMTVVNKFAGSLQVLHLEIYPKYKHNAPKPLTKKDLAAIDDSIKFPHMRLFNIPYNSVSAPDFMIELGKKFVNMQVLQFIQYKGLEKRRGSAISADTIARTVSDIKKELKPVWDHMPGSMQTIFVRRQVFSPQGLVSPGIAKCTRTKITTLMEC